MIGISHRGPSVMAWALAAQLVASLTDIIMLSPNDGVLSEGEHADA